MGVEHCYRLKIYQIVALLDLPHVYITLQWAARHAMSQAVHSVVHDKTYLVVTGNQSAPVRCYTDTPYRHVFRWDLAAREISASQGSFLLKKYLPVRVYSYFLPNPKF
jgi:hypothetical protein